MLQACAFSCRRLSEIALVWIRQDPASVPDYEELRIDYTIPVYLQKYDNSDNL